MKEKSDKQAGSKKRGEDESGGGCGDEYVYEKVTVWVGSWVW